MCSVRFVWRLIARCRHMPYPEKPLAPVLFAIWTPSATPCICNLRPRSLPATATSIVRARTPATSLPQVILSLNNTRYMMRRRRMRRRRRLTMVTSCRCDARVNISRLFSDILCGAVHARTNLHSRASLSAVATQSAVERPKKEAAEAVAQY